MYNNHNNNDSIGIFANTLKIFGFAFIIAVLKYVAIAFGMIALIVGGYYLIKEKLNE
jgi:hypothetical protein